MKSLLLLVVGVLHLAACTGQSVVTNINHRDLAFTEIRSNFEFTDMNKYGCEKINASVIRHVLETGTLITSRDVHDYYSTTGCSIKGSMVVNGNETDFTFEYGGVLYFKNEMILGCGQGCCTNGFPHCSWESPATLQ